MDVEYIIDPRTGRQAQIIRLNAIEYSRWEAVLAKGRQRVDHSMMLGAGVLLLAIVVGGLIAVWLYLAGEGILSASAFGICVFIMSFMFAYDCGRNVSKRWRHEVNEEKSAILKPHGTDYEFLKVAWSREHFLACNLAPFKYVVAPPQ